MKTMLYKELKLAASFLSYFFIAAALLAFVPGYPILLSAFFTTLGIFYSFQNMRESGDIKYSLLLPVSKADIVKGKYAFVLLIELCSFVPTVIITLVRMAFFADAKIYTSNALMCANLVFLGFVLLIFGLFNSIFVCGFFKTGYYFGKPFILYCAVSLIVIFAAEALHHIPKLGAVNSLGFENIAVQLAFLLAGISAFAALTFCGAKRAQKLFEKVDL